MGDRLKPCPFCGGDKVHLIGYDAASGRKTAPECWVTCGTCGATSNTSSFPENATSYWNTRPEAADEGDLDERMTAAGMIPLSELLESHGPMEKFKQHAAVKTFDDFVWWIKSQQKKFMTMRMQYELGDKDKSDDLFEWVFAHAAVYDQIATQLRALEPDTVTDDLSKSIADFVSRQEPLGAEFEQVLADNIEELYETQPDTAADTVTGWQDISTAPKDGTWFLGYTPRRVHGWPWLKSKGAIISFRWWGKGEGDKIPWFSNMDGFPQPTHWMPLPPAPEKEG